MKLDEYLQTVSEQIRYTKIRPSVTEELKNHILDQAEVYEECGAFPEEALERAVREMGDPVETGVALDRIHRPQMNWGIVTAIAVISLLSIGVFYIADIVAPDAYPWQRQAIFVMSGFLMMLLVYRLDYSILGNFGWKPAVLFLCIMIVGLVFWGFSIHGANRWIDIGPFVISVPEAMILYIPLFGAALYSFRGEGYGVLLKVLPLIVVPVGFVWLTPTLSNALILFASLFSLFMFAVWKDWFCISKKLVLGISCSLSALSPAAFLGYFYFFGEAYQVDRIHAFLNPSKNNTWDYIVNMAKNMRINSSMVGSSEHSVEWFVNGPTTDFLTDYILVSMCSLYGIFLTVVIVAGLIVIVMNIFHISMNQKNQLGMIVGMGCGIAFFIKTAASVLMNLQLIPYISISMPFLSYGGSNTIVSYILLGLVLSVYRYKNILPKESRQKPKHILRLRLEWETR